MKRNTREYQICNRCVMDTSAADIRFDAHGNGQYCANNLQKLEALNMPEEQRLDNLQKLLSRVSKAGRGRKYDCVIGLSGGLDSAYTLYYAKKIAGLRPLAVHLDNGWNSELANNNIERLVNTLGVDLHVHVIDWEENRDMQRSMFKANVVDIEMLLDNAVATANYEAASRWGIKYFLAGTNTSTEGMGMPVGWAHHKFDAKNVRAIHKTFGSVLIKTHPLMGTMRRVFYHFIKKIHWVSFLDYIPYTKAAAIADLEREVGYRPYPYKHYESIFTRFYQAYILPRKFGYDKRRPHLSSLILSHQITREDALKTLEGPPYADATQMQEDRDYVLKKLGFDDKWFDDYLKSPQVPHSDYPSEASTYNKLRGLGVKLGLIHSREEHTPHDRNIEQKK